jgi:glycosyltransferase involved in cell wall biosynthesis
LYADYLRSIGLDPVKYIEVFATAAKDHRTWENHYPVGKEIVGGVGVTRFAVDRRDLDVFIRAELDMQAGRPLTINEQLDWLGAGVNSLDLYSALRDRIDEFDLVVLAPYLFPITFFGGLIAGRKAVVLPCLHDEHYAYLEVFRSFFDRVGGLIFNSQPEQQLFHRLFPGIEPPLGAGIVGVPIPVTGIINETLKNPLRDKLYLTYCGRKETGKNLDLLIGYFDRARELWEVDVSLALIGSGQIDFLDVLPPGVVDLGYLPENEKLCVISESLALCQPSLNESFSIVLMEAWSQGVPVLVHGASAVTRYHVEQSGGGLYFEDAAEFYVTVKRLMEDRELARRLGASGYDYVCKQYSREAVQERLLSLLEDFCKPRQLEQSVLGIHT